MPLGSIPSNFGIVAVLARKLPSVPFCRLRKRNDEAILSALALQSAGDILSGEAMFLTFEHAEVPMGALVQGGHSWRYVEYPTTYPWFHVALTELDGTEHRSTTFHVYSTADLIELAESTAHQLQIERVLLVSPGHLNGSGNWQMDELLEISEVSLENSFSLVYRLLDERALYEDDRARDADARQTHTVFVSPWAGVMRDRAEPAEGSA